MSKSPWPISLTKCPAENPGTTYLLKFQDAEALKGS